LTIAELATILQAMPNQEAEIGIRFLDKSENMIMFCEGNFFGRPIFQISRNSDNMEWTLELLPAYVLVDTKMR